MRSGVAAIQVTSSAQIDDDIITSADIKDGEIANIDVSATAAIAYSKLNLTGLVVNADIGAAAAIAYSKLNLTGEVSNADIKAATGIAYSKLNLTGGVVDADVNAAAAIVSTKLVLTALAQNLLPAADNGVSLGSVAKTFLEIHARSIFAEFTKASMIPSPTDSLDIGGVSNVWDTIYVNDIQGPSRALIMMGI